MKINEHGQITTTLDGLVLRPAQPKDYIDLYVLLKDNKQHMRTYGEIEADQFPTPASFYTYLHEAPISSTHFCVWMHQVRIGYARVQRDTQTPEIAKIYLWIGRPFMMKKYGTTALNALVQAIFSAPVDEPVEEIVTTVSNKNEPARKTLARTGLRAHCTTEDQQHFRLERAHARIYV